MPTCNAIEFLTLSRAQLRSLLRAGNAAASLPAVQAPAKLFDGNRPRPEPEQAKPKKKGKPPSTQGALF